MKVLAINGSPRGPWGNTERILQPFLEGAREAGAETEVVYSSLGRLARRRASRGHLLCRWRALAE